MFLSDKSIRRLVADGTLGITPFESQQVREVNGEKVLSYGLGPAGYDVRLKPVWKVFKRNEIPRIFYGLSTPENYRDFKELTESFNTSYPKLIDPKNFDESVLHETHSDELLLWPGEYALAVTLERFTLPDNLQGTFFAKSTYARCGLLLNTTNVQPGFDGEVVMEFYNAAGSPIVIRANEGFAQIKFELGDSEVEQGYSGNGAYHGQSGVQTPKV